MVNSEVNEVTTRMVMPYCFLFEGKWYFGTEEAKIELEMFGIKFLPR